MPICTVCGTDVPARTQPGQDNSTFICDRCQSAANVESWRKELKEIQKLGAKANDSQLKRSKFLTDLISKAEAE